MHTQKQLWVLGAATPLLTRVCEVNRGRRLLLSVFPLRKHTHTHTHTGRKLMTTFTLIGTVTLTSVWNVLSTEPYLHLRHTHTHTNTIHKHTWTS